MDELETAVLLCLNPVADKNLRERALQYCQNLRQSQDGWAFVLQRLSTHMRPEVAFWCLQVIHETLSDQSRYPASFSNDQVVAIRAKLLEYFSHVVYPEKFINGTAQGMPHATPVPFPSFLLNKLAQILVSVIAADFPHVWPNAFQDTVLPLVSPNQASESSTVMFFRILRALDEDVTSIRATQISETARKTSIRVKDAMRDNCVTALISRCADLISSPRYVSLAFDVISRYVEWMDIGLIVQDKIISPMYATIASASVINSRPAAAVALRAIMTKRMDAASKVELMNSLQIETLLRSIPVNIVCADEEELGNSELGHQSGQVEVAALVNTTIVVALEVLKEATKNGTPVENGAEVAATSSRIAQVALPVALRFLNENTDEGTSSQTLQCVTAYVNIFSRVTRCNKNGTTGEGIAAMIAILKVVEERALFGKEFDPDDDKSEDQRSFFDLRRVLLKSVFGSVVRPFPGMCLEFVSSLFAKAASNGDIPRTELALSMLIALVVTSPETPELNDLRSKVVANPPECMSFDSGMSRSVQNSTQLAQKHQLERVSTTYFDLVARSYRLFLTRANPALLSAVFPAFLDNRGMGHRSSEKVRSKAAYSLLKLMKPLRGIITMLQLDAILGAVQIYLFPLNKDVAGQGSRDQMMIYEAVGYLLGTDHKRESSMKYLSAVLQSLIEGLHTNDYVSALPFITAAGFLSKGFGGDSKPLLLLNESRQETTGSRIVNPQFGNDDSSKEVKIQRVTPIGQEMQMIWMSCLEAVLKASSSVFGMQRDSSLEDVRSKLVFFLHRMVDTIGARMLPYLEQSVSSLLNTSRSAVELRDVIILVSQAVTKFGTHSESLVMHVYAPIVQYAHQHSYTLDPKSSMAISEESRETVEMHRAYTYFMHAIIGTELIKILIHPNHQSLIQVVMTSLLSSATGESLDFRVSASVMKMSLHMLRAMIMQWTGVSAHNTEQNGPPGFKEWALKEITNATLMSGLRGCIFRMGEYDSGEAVSVLTEIVMLQRSCASNLGPEFGERLQNGPLAALPKSKVDTYLSALYSPETLTSNLVPAFATLCKMLRMN